MCAGPTFLPVCLSSVSKYRSIFYLILHANIVLNEFIKHRFLQRAHHQLCTGHRSIVGIISSSKQAVVSFISPWWQVCSKAFSKARWTPLRDHRPVLNWEVNRIKSRGITVCINISKGQKKEANGEPKDQREHGWGGRGVKASVKTAWNAHGWTGNEPQKTQSAPDKMLSHLHTTLSLRVGVQQWLVKNRRKNLKKKKSFLLSHVINTFSVLFNALAFYGQF